MTFSWLILSHFQYLTLFRPGFFLVLCDRVWGGGIRPPVNNETKRTDSTSKNFSIEVRNIS